MAKKSTEQPNTIVIVAASPADLQRLRNLYLEMKAAGMYAGNIDDKIAILTAVEALEKAGDDILKKLDEIGESLNKSLTEIQQEKVKLITSYDHEEVNTYNGTGLALKKDGEKYDEAKAKLDAMNKKYAPKLTEISTGETELQSAYEKKFPDKVSISLPIIEKKKLKDLSFASLESAIKFGLLK